MGSQKLLLLMLFLSGLIGYLEAYQFMVGGREGWVSNPSENYNQWAARMRFNVNDTLFFKYKKGSDSVLVVSKDDYDKCNNQKPIVKMEDGDSVFKFDRSGPFYFITGNKPNCDKGQKLITVVLAVRTNNKKPKSPPPSPSAGAPSSFPPSNAPSMSTPSPTPKSPSPTASSPYSSSPVSNPPSMSTPSPTPASSSPYPAPVVMAPSSATIPVMSPTPAGSPETATSPVSPSPATTPGLYPTPAGSPGLSPTPAGSPGQSLTPTGSPATAPVSSPPAPPTSMTPSPSTTGSNSPGTAMAPGTMSPQANVNPTAIPPSSAPAFAPSIVLVSLITIVLSVSLGSFVGSP